MAIETVPAVETIRKLTPDDVWRMLETGELDWDDNFELVDGEIVEVLAASGDHGIVEMNIGFALKTFSNRAGGRVFGSSGFTVGPNRRNVRAPDVSYIGPERAQDSYPKWVQGAPDLAVEVLSPDQHTDRYAKPKVREYLEAGAQVVWLVDPIKHEVRVYRPDADEYLIYRRDAELTLEPIISGFSLKVSDIFT